MARLPRVVVPGFPHHVTQRGNRKANIYRDEEDRKVYLRVLLQRSKQYRLDILSYCLMTNHIHLVAVPQEEHSLTKALRDTHGLYALYFNRKYELTGHLWQGRFFSCVLDESHLWAAVRYVERNPVRAKLIERAEMYPWSSAGARCGLTKDSLLANLVAPKGLIADWGAWLGQDGPEAQLQTIRQNTKTGRPLGPDCFVEQLESKLGRTLKPQKPGRRPQ